MSEPLVEVRDLVKHFPITKGILFQHQVAAVHAVDGVSFDVMRGEELVPIGGRPPSLINLPSGCHFHPRCPYVRESHTRVDPVLDPIDGDPGHKVACLLDTPTRKRLWRELSAGKPPEEARADVVEEEMA